MQITGPEQTFILTTLSAAATFLAAGGLGISGPIQYLSTALVSACVAYFSHSASINGNTVPPNTGSATNAGKP